MSTTSGNFTTATDTLELTYSADTKILATVSGTYGTGLGLKFEISKDGVEYISWPGATLDPYPGGESARTLGANEGRTWRFLGVDVGTKFKVSATAWPVPSGTCVVTITSYPTQGSSEPGGSSGAAVTIADGADVAQGTTTDAAVGDATGTVNAHLRYLDKATGEIQASPTANTILGRLKDILTGIVLAAGSAIIGKVTTDRTTPGTTNSVAIISGQDGVAGGAGAVGATVQRVVLATDTTVPTDPVNSGIGAARASSQAIAVTTSGAGYVATDCVGGIISLTTVNYASGRRVNLRSVCIKEKGGAAPSLHIEFYKATPSAGTYTDNSALVRGSGDSANRVGTLNVQSSDYLTDITETTVTYNDINMKMPVAATTLFMLIISQGSYTLTNGNLTINLEFDAE